MEMTVDYFRSEGAPWIYACLRPKASFLRLPDPFGPGDRWEWIQRGTETWSARDQDRFWNGRAESVEPETVARLPPLPDASTEPPAWQPATTVEAKQVPTLATWLKQRQGEGAWIAILGEDTYETSLGDGEFHYLEGVLEIPAEAEQFVRRRESEPYTKCHRRAVRFALQGSVVDINLERGVFDHAEPVAVALVVEKALLAS